VNPATEAALRVLRDDVAWWGQTVLDRAPGRGAAGRRATLASCRSWRRLRLLIAAAELPAAQDGRR